MERLQRQRPRRQRSRMGSQARIHEKPAKPAKHQRHRHRHFVLPVCGSGPVRGGFPARELECLHGIELVGDDCGNVGIAQRPHQPPARSKPRETHREIPTRLSSRNSPSHADDVSELSIRPGIPSKPCEGEEHGTHKRTNR